MSVELIERPPRIQPELPVAEKEIAAAPSHNRNGIEEVVQSVLPLIGMLGMAFGALSGNPLVIVMMLLTLGGSLGVSLWLRARNRAEQARKRGRYAAYLLELRQELARDHNAQRMFYTHAYPDVTTLLNIAARSESSRFGVRLWERRPGDEDFGMLRLGMGARASSVLFKSPGKPSPIEDEQQLQHTAQRLADDSAVLNDVPITLGLIVPEPTLGDSVDANNPAAPTTLCAHSVGVYGASASTTADFARAVLAHLCGFHSPHDVRLHVIGHAGRAAQWRWAEWLPHVAEVGMADAEEDASQAAIDQLCLSDDAGQQRAFWARLQKLIEGRVNRAQTRDVDADQAEARRESSLPLHVLVVDLLGDIPAGSPLLNAASEGAVALIHSRGQVLGVSLIMLANSPTPIPAESLALIEVASTHEGAVFRYTEVGRNSARHIGRADQLGADDARTRFAAQLRRLDVARPFGADLPTRVDLLQMHALQLGAAIRTADKLPIGLLWARSRMQAGDWPAGAVGMASVKDVRSLWFTAREGGDGVHGMIAGTTGSGKSELLQSLILSLAIRHDPRLLNVVLVDYKGGSTIEPFRKLPHAVDLLTNLQPNAVARMFVAIQAVIEKRSAVLARSGSKDLAEYRARQPWRRDAGLPGVFPHLFVIVDEFAEMLAANPDYKAQFESITRLGRAVGVSLILATQRPAGLVTDQMRSNMKFRVCLRVETVEDSREMLGVPDAALLPNIAGRGFVKVGSDGVQPIQVAFSGADYGDDRSIALKDVIWTDDEPLPSQDADPALYAQNEILEALGRQGDGDRLKLMDWITAICALRAQRDGVPPQRKPWPDPLPAQLVLNEPLDAAFLNTDADTPNGMLTLAPELAAWVNDDVGVGWPASGWSGGHVLDATIGLVDRPQDAEQQLLTINLGRDALVVFGGAGRGKTTFVKSLLLALAARRTPDALNMYLLDFGRGGLKPLSALPHVGASVDAGEPARVEQLLRMLRNMLSDRQECFARSQTTTLTAHNAANPSNCFAEVLTVIDNIAEFRDNHDNHISELLALVRDGRPLGLMFVITAQAPADLGPKLGAVFANRITFSQPNRDVYAEIVGHGAPPFDDVPGRGLMALPAGDGLQPHAVQIATLLPPGVDSNLDAHGLVAQRMDATWRALGHRRPAAELPRTIGLLELLSLLDHGRADLYRTPGDVPIAATWQASMLPASQGWLHAPLGLTSSTDVRELNFQAQADGVHGMIAGTTGSGKSELLQTLILSLALRYDPRLLNFVLVDYKGGATIEPFRKLPHVVDMATDQQGNAVERIFTAINAEMDRRARILAESGVSDLVAYRRDVLPKRRADQPPAFPHLFVIVDEFAEMVSRNPGYKAQFETITRLGRAYGVSLILATQRPAGAVSDQMRSNMKFKLALRVESEEDSRELLKRGDAARLPQIAGRGYLQVGTESINEMQLAYSGANFEMPLQDTRYKREELLAALGLEEGRAPGKMVNWLVAAMAAEAVRAGIAPQFKPWPDPLPAPDGAGEVALWPLPIDQALDASYIAGHTTTTMIVSPDLAAWRAALATDLANLPPQDARPGAAIVLTGVTPELRLWALEQANGLWPLIARFGLVDNPHRAEQHVLALDVGADPIVIFGASGKGKTSLLKSMMFDLAAQLHPNALNIYALDFGRGGLRALGMLPHCGAVIDGVKADRVGQVLRMLRGLIGEREEKLAKFAGLADHNIQMRARGMPDAVLSAVAVVIDNIAEFKDGHEALLPELISVIRDGRGFGIHFVITAGGVGDVPPKLMNVLGQRLSLGLSDVADYADVIGRGALPLPNLPGRGLINLEGMPLEFQSAMPTMLGVAEPFVALAHGMAGVWERIGGRRPSAEIPRSIGLLELHHILDNRPVNVIGDLDIAGNWARSMQPDQQAWLSAPIGVVSSREVRTLHFNARAGGDGVHGMVAGTTGSGKSELIQTLICALAIKYDPRIVNFVLVDYKGGATIEPFRKLPHVVDLATNLQGNAVERIFIAITAEMNRRSALLARAGVADLVEYRRAIIPTLMVDAALPRAFPHLFIIVDEFAEMITNNPEYKSRFDSITRLGRAVGVSLILATQRPSGAVSDQMRANMKFRICLRVETNDDSREMLGRNDAAQLPAIGGRGYAQVGGGALSELQAAWTGAPYDESRPDAQYPTAAILQALGADAEPPRSTLGWLVGAMALEAQRQRIGPQFTPWPGALPELLLPDMACDATYFAPRGLPKPAVVLSPHLAAWINNSAAAPVWPQRSASDGVVSLRVNAGLADDPYAAEQRLVEIDLAADPLLVMGGGGRGKSQLLKLLALDLAAQHSPRDLHIYALDFGRGGLRSLRALPHVAGVVEAREEERVERFFRMLRNMLNDRQMQVQAHDDLADFNARNPARALPAVLVLVDAVAELKENFEHHVTDLIALVRDGRALGMTFAVSAQLLADVPGKLFNLLTQRVAFSMRDPGATIDVVGRAAPHFADLPGRGVTALMLDGRPHVLEFQAAMPVLAGSDAVRLLAERMALAWECVPPALRASRPKKIEPLPLTLPLADVLPEVGAPVEGLIAAIGLNDVDREPARIDFKVRGPNLLVLGPPLSGKTTALRSLVLALAHSHTPQQLGLVLVDGSDSARRFFNYGADEATTLATLPHVLGTASTAHELSGIVARLRAEFAESTANAKRPIVMIFDHYDESEGLNHGIEPALDALSEIGKGRELYFVIAGTPNVLRSNDTLRRRVESSRFALVLQDAEIVRNMGVRLPHGSQRELPPGRGFLVKAVGASVIQVALPAVEGRDGLSPSQQLFAHLLSLHGVARASWQQPVTASAPVQQAPVAVETLAVPDAASIETLAARQRALMAALAEPGEPLVINLVQRDLITPDDAAYGAVTDGSARDVSPMGEA